MDLESARTEAHMGVSGGRAALQGALEAGSPHHFILEIKCKDV